MGQMCRHTFMVVFDPILLILSGNEHMHKSLDEFEFSPDQTSVYRVNCPLNASNKCIHYFLVAIDLILFKLASYKDILKYLR